MDVWKLIDDYLTRRSGQSSKRPRERLALSDLSEELGMSRNYLSCVRAEQFSPSPETARKIMQRLSEMELLKTPAERREFLLSFMRIPIDSEVVKT